jgi:hypothetical protein
MTCGKFYLNCEQMIHFALKQDAAGRVQQMLPNAFGYQAPSVG